MNKPLQITPGSALDRKAKEIAKLYNGICAAVRTAASDGIRIGGMLLDVHDSPAFKGKWLAFLDECIPFDQKTAWRFMECYKRRDELGKLPNPTMAALLALPSSKPKKKRRNREVEELVSKGIARDEKAARRMIAERNEKPGDPITITEATADNSAVVVPQAETPLDEAPPPQPKGWQPDALSASDLTDAENAALASLRAYLADAPTGRAKVLMRYVCEKLRGEL